MKIAHRMAAMISAMMSVPTRTLPAVMYGRIAVPFIICAYCSSDVS